MRISTRGRYGMRAMLDLAEHFDEGPIPVKSIAERQGISVHYLEQILNKLKRVGLVKSVRGIKGGYSLAKRPEQISAEDVIGVLEGSISPVSCLDNGANCDRADECATRILWADLKKSIDEVLSATTLADLCKEKDVENKAE